MMFHSKADVMARAKQLLKEIEPPDDMFGPRYIYEIIGAAEEAAEKAAARWGADGWKGCMVYMLTDVHLSWGYVGQGQGNRPIQHLYAGLFQLTELPEKEKWKQCKALNKAIASTIADGQHLCYFEILSPLLSWEASAGESAIMELMGINGDWLLNDRMNYHNWRLRTDG